jgi:hypothetical protein
MGYEPHYCPNFKINDHNLDYFVEAFSREQQPTQLLVPCDYDRNEIVVPAPNRWVVEREILKYDVLESIGNQDLDVSLIKWPWAWKSGKVKVSDPNDRKPIIMEWHKVYDNLSEIRTRVHPEEIYLFSSKDQGYLRRMKRLEKKFLSVEIGGISRTLENPFSQCLEF